MQFIDLKTQFERIEEDVITRVNAVLRSQRYIMGPEVQKLEEQLADFAGTKHAFTCASGTDALVIPLMAYELAESDAVFVPSFTFFASAESITLAGGTPIFVDIDESTFNIDPVHLENEIERVLGEGKLKPRGVMPVDLFGRLADYDAIWRIADKYDLFVIEDACQGFGASLSGKRACSFGNVGATSFFPAKPLGCYGDGGAIFTDDDELASLIMSIRVHGQGVDKYDNVRIGVNGRFDAIQAAIVLAKLQVFEDELIRRAQVAQYYTEHLSDILRTPTVPEQSVSAWAQYTLVAEDAEQRTKILSGMKEKGVPSAVYYPVPIHRSTAYRNLGYEDVSLPVSEALASKVFSIPMHPYLNEKDMDKVVDAIKGSL
ncbi:DegT/DnrJ/EryC1/StrS family aminotransferase [Raoultibacter phocaeensis]|uniref:DegT/DnrJ/EryC1/StrS family aminotransferase n=1 Tax=Raoultibacter phocaeensis TaxID=2479841 RepID=UPI001117C5E7|nr:DegT/DnrJ/EryC1/StrS family aminotransferase [Raoultibacter phocaeensis]